MPATVVDRVGVSAHPPEPWGRRRVIVTCVHGTWARGDRWPELEEWIADAFGSSAPVEVRYFTWSGRNSVRARTRAAGALRQFLRDDIPRSPGARHILIAHSHGANIVLRMLDGAGREITDAVADLILLSPPLLNCRVVDDATAAANKLLLGALAVLPLLFIPIVYATTVLGFGKWTEMAVLAAASALWVGLFWPARVRRHAERLARQLALPRLDVPGLIVRAPLDEATAMLASVTTFARLARWIWSQILHLRPRVTHETDRRLTEACVRGDLVYAVFAALVTVHVCVIWIPKLPGWMAGGEWLTMAFIVPLMILNVITATLTVGGSVLLLALLPALSFLLWPFGIAPTVAAALLTVSIENAPTPRWIVVHLREGGEHATYRDPAALDAVRTHLRRMAAR